MLYRCQCHGNWHEGATYCWYYQILLNAENGSRDALVVGWEKPYLDIHQVVGADSSELGELLSTFFQEEANSIPFLTLEKA